MTTPVHSPPLDLLTTAVLEALKATELPVWDHSFGGDPARPAYPYGILYRLPGGSSDPFPDLAANPRALVVPYQLTAVSKYRNQCEAAGRVFRDRILTRTPGGWLYDIAAPDGWSVTGRRPDPTLPGVDKGGQPPSVTYSQPFRFYLTVAPV